MELVINLHFSVYKIQILKIECNSCNLSFFFPQLIYKAPKWNIFEIIDKWWKLIKFCLKNNESLRVFGKFKFGKNVVKYTLKIETW